ncbi:hypothetical protein GCK72_025958 [Caenorhabditis remanei]|uniref:Uncharacterized protein n=1 Tax=Caenorhabditis remanei TaxID=31234 RepID=A0A6A5G3K5_CAERE|nr:hypothetical protein GCK72_025958 [Caenorhabditis remanei]KAF1749490.1 hypothetical protein GCK72_025958 [Caenorhabditis remanei]
MLSLSRKDMKKTCLLCKKKKVVVGLCHAMAHCYRGAVLTGIAKSLQLETNFRRQTKQIVQHRKIDESVKQTVRAINMLDSRVYHTLAALFGSFPEVTQCTVLLCPAMGSEYAVLQGSQHDNWRVSR